MDTTTNHGLEGKKRQDKSRCLDKKEMVLGDRMGTNPIRYDMRPKSQDQDQGQDV